MGKDNSANKAAGKAAKAQTQIAQQLIDESSPVRQQLYGQANDFLAGNRDVTSLPEYAALKSGVEGQYSRARDSIIGATPEGGALTSALVDLEMGRANTLAQGAGSIASDEVNRAAQLASFGAAQGSSGFNAAAMTQAQRAAAESQQNAGKAGGLGTGLGGLAGYLVSK